MRDWLKKIASGRKNKRILMEQSKLETKSIWPKGKTYSRCQKGIHLCDASHLVIVRRRRKCTSYAKRGKPRNDAQETGAGVMRRKKQTVLKAREIFV